MSDAGAPIPLFPLGTVLFPRGVLGLRVFETRYLDMVRGCMRDGSPFGVCLITRGGEVGEAAEHEAVGCLATIVDWDMETAGILQVRAIGGERFRVVSREIGRDRLIRADVDPIAPDPVLPVPAGLSGPVGLLRQAVERHVADTPEPAMRRVAEPFEFDSAAWVGNRLAELLPASSQTRQRLMAMTDPIERLTLIDELLRGLQDA